MTTEPSSAVPGEDPDGWLVLARALVEAGAGADDDEVEWAMREARMLVLDGRATTAALESLAARHAFGAWATLRDCSTGTAEHLLAVLRGWDSAGIPGTGHTRARLPGAAPTAPVEVAAVWCAAAAHRLGLGTADTFSWASAGLLDPLDAPDPGWAPDPVDGPDADPAPSPEDDEVFRRLRDWLRLVGTHDAPAGQRAGLGPVGAATVLSLPHQHPERRRLLGY